MTAKARSLAEIRFAVSLVPCPGCGTRAPEGLELAGYGTSWAFSGKCAKCRSVRGGAFITKGSPYGEAPPYELGEGSSELITGEQFLRELERVVPLVVEDPTKLDPEAWRRSEDANERAVICLHELLKLILPGAEKVPGLNDARATRSWLESELVKQDALLAIHLADKDRVWKIEHPPKPAPVGTFDRAALEHHAEWLASGRRVGTRLELRNHDFSHANLGNPKLTAARLVKVILDGADLRYITLDEAELLGVSANGANFAWASLQGAVVHKGSYVRASFELVSLDGAQVTGSDFTEANLERTRWAGTRFDAVIALGARFGSSVLDAGRFVGCNLRGASFINDQTVLPCTTRAWFEDCDLRETRWAGRDLAGATFVRCMLAGSSGPVTATAALTVTDCDLALIAWTAQLGGREN